MDGRSRSPSPAPAPGSGSASGARLTLREALATELDGSEHALLQADLSTLDGCEAFVDDAFAALEHVDVWVNNAGADVLTGDPRSWPSERKLKVLSSST